ncbi:MAG: hypothetical protein C4531_03445 [Desulfurivibrio sp.]|nr:MAG: hypothetical protein C4531_03445 [Desulfurivibrio sp.]
MAAPSLDGCVFLLALLLINVSAFAGKTLLFALSVSAGADECRLRGRPGWFCGWRDLQDRENIR